MFSTESVFLIFPKIPQSQTILPPRRSPRKRAEAKRKLQELDRSDSEAEITVGETPVSCRTVRDFIKSSHDLDACQLLVKWTNRVFRKHFLIT